MRSFLTPLALAGALLLAPMAQAHDSWINHGAYRSPINNEWCCGEGDCGILDHGAVQVKPGGYRVDGFVTIGEGAGAIREKVLEFVPFNEALPSPDGEYWRCRRANGSRRCFFAPPPTD